MIKVTKFEITRKLPSDKNLFLEEHFISRAAAIRWYSALIREAAEHKGVWYHKDMWYRESYGEFEDMGYAWVAPLIVEMQPRIVRYVEGVIDGVPVSGQAVTPPDDAAWGLCSKGRGGLPPPGGNPAHHRNHPTPPGMGSIKGSRYEALTSEAQADPSRVRDRPCHRAEGLEFPCLGIGVRSNPPR